MARTRLNYTLRRNNGVTLFLPPDVDTDLVNLSRPDPFAESSVQKYPLGTLLEFDGRLFRYSLMGAAAVTKGKLLQNAVVAADHIKDLACAAAAAAALTITVTNGATTAISANDFAEGWVFINAGAGLGQVFRIKSHPAAAVDATCVLTLHDDYPVVTALTTASKAGLIRNRFKSVVVNPTTRTGRVVGVTVIDITAAYYFWALTKGLVALLTNGTVIRGLHVVPGATTAGSVDVRPLNSVDAGGQEQVVGEVLSVGATTEYSLVNVNLE